MLQLPVPQSPTTFLNTDYEQAEFLGIRQVQATETEEGPSLSVDISSPVLNALLLTEGCDGIRLFPGIDGDELVLIAVAARLFMAPVFLKPFDVVGSADIACIGYHHESQSSSHTLSMELRLNYLQPTGSASPNLSSLQTMQYSTGTNDIFKAFFPKGFLESLINAGNPAIRFEMGELLFNDGSRYKTVTARGVNETVLNASFLPCPPNCGGGGGGGDYVNRTI